MKKMYDRYLMPISKIILRTMKLTLILVALNIVNCFASAYSQKVSLNLNNVKFYEAINEISRQTNLDFAYSKEVVDMNRTVSISVKNTDLKNVLDRLLEGTHLMHIELNDKIYFGSKEFETVIQTTLLQQKKKLSGTITDATTGEIIIGANFRVEGTTGTVTDVNGKFSLDIPSPDAVVVVSYLGYNTQRIKLDGQTVLDIKMVPDITKLEEVVVVGYGTIKKKDLTGAVSVVKSGDFKDLKALSIGEAMQGLVSGVTVRSGGGIGNEPRVEIRGIGNFSNNNPLYVIDGLPSTGGRDFNVNDIESIQILKDASAAAIYGSRAANGVIIITTKKGDKGPMKIDFSSKVGIENLPQYNLMGRDEWIKYNNMAYDEAIANNVSGVTSRQNQMDGNTNWQKEAFKTGITQDYNLGFSGGGNNGNYLVSMNYVGNSGTTYGTGLKRYNFRVNTEGTRGIFTIGENVAISNTIVNEESSIWGRFADVIRMLPTIPVYDANNPGGYGYGDEARARTFGSNPIATQNLMPKTNENLRVRGNVYADLNIFKFLKYRLNAGFESSNENYKFLRKVGNFTLNQPYDPSNRNENKGKYLSALLENTLSFKKDFGMHHIDAVAGTTYQAESYEQIWAEKKNLVSIGDHYYDVLDAGTTDANTGGYRWDTYLISYLGRLNYDYDGKYLLSATVRRDGNSKFIKDLRWGNFPSASLGWRISKERFFKVNWISDLKVRANYGTLGNANIGAYDYLASLNSFPIAVFGTNQHLENGMTQIKLVNKDIRWETKTQKNFGVDVAFFKNKLQFSGEYFISTTKDVLTPMPILMSTGNDGGNPYVNAASLENKGVELSATWKDKKGDFTYSVTTNFTRLRNKVLEFGYGKTTQYTAITKTEIGEPLAMFYLIKTDGIFQTLTEIQNYKNSDNIVIQPDAKPGDIKYVDFNNDGKITSDDRQIAGNPWPKFDIGLNLNASYKDWDFSVYGFGSFGNDAYNGASSLLNRFDDNTSYLKGINPWTPTNTNTNFPRIIYADQRNSRGDQDRWLENGSFFKIRQITLGYTFKKAMLRNVVDNVRLSVTGQNLFTFTKYTGLDPEFISPDIWTKGQDNISYPSPKTLVFSVKFTF